jgi:ornithine decarboxylase
MKANSEPEVLGELHTAGAGFEVASADELELLSTLGVDPSAVVYGTAVKPRDHIRRAVAAGVDTFAFDSASELLRIADSAPGARVYVRVVASHPDSAYSMSEKFGAPAGRAVELLCMAAQLGLQPWGLSFNIGSQVRSPGAWETTITALAPVLARARQVGLELEILNIGGGFPHPYAGSGRASDLAEVAARVRRALMADSSQTLMLEPGRAIVADSMVLVASVIGCSQRSGRRWLYLDAGVYNGLFETLACQGSIPHAVSSPEGTSAYEDETEVVLAGPTGDGLDVIGNVMLPRSLREGDRVVFHDVGAYSRPFVSSFNGFPAPPVHIATWEVDT